MNIDLRDWFAGLAMQSFLNQSHTGVIGKEAYMLADAMLEARIISIHEKNKDTIHLMYLDKRSINVLKAYGVFRISDLLNMTFTDLMKIPNCGSYTAKKIRQEVHKLGYKLKGEQ